MAAVAAIAAALAVAAGCGGGSHPQTTHAAAAVHVCKLSAKQRRLMRRLKRMIVHMHRLEAPLKTVHEQGPMPLELELNRFLLKVGFLPVQEREDLIREAKSAVGLCRDCFDALESAEPALQTKFGGSPCAPGV